MGLCSRGLVVAVAHGVCSASLNILLKVLFSHLNFPCPSTVQLCGALISASILALLRRAPAPLTIPMDPLDLSLISTCLPLVVLAVVHPTLTLLALRFLTLPTYVTFKRCTPLATACLSSLALPSVRHRGVAVSRVSATLAATLTASGAIITALGDVSGTREGYVCGVACVLLHACYLVAIEKVHAEHGLDPLTMQYAATTCSAPVFALFALSAGDPSLLMSPQSWAAQGVVAAFLGSITLVAFLSFTMLQCTVRNSAITTSFVGVAKSIAMAVVGLTALADAKPSFLSICGVILSALGGTTYAVTTWRSRRGVVKHAEGTSSDEIRGGSDSA
uniref:solute carrier family 35 member D3 n=1 Tax=Myxine glutinosa TaxID=7769 RepID=UPI00358FAF76